MPSYPTLIAGTPLVWQASGGDYVLTLTSLASDAARQGDKGDLYDSVNGRLPHVLDVMLQSAVAVAATTGLKIELWAGESASGGAGTNNPGGLTGADGALSSPDQLKRQLYWIGGLTLANALGTGQQRQRFAYTPTARCFLPVVVNKSGQALSGTAGDHVLTVTPYYWQVG